VKKICLSFVLASLVLIAAPGYAGQAAPAPPAPPAPESPAPSTDVVYRLQSGDEIEIKVFEVAELADRVRVRPDGKISVLLLDDVQAAGLTPSDLDDVLTKGYAAYYQNPRVTVIVRGFSNQRVYVGGEVNTPGMLQMSGGMSLVGAVLEAGGFRPTAKRSSVILLRKGENGPQVRRLNIDEMLENGTSDVELQPFDVVFVPKTFIAKANLFVQQYIRDLLPVATTANFTYVLGQTVSVVP
jgi:protein involved in polysaccharide export with SLBB domain